MLGSIRKALTLVAFLSLLAALRAVEAQTEPQNEPTNLEGTSWQLVKFQGSDDKTLTPDARQASNE